MSEGVEVFTLAERPDLEAALGSLPNTFPEFMHHDAVVNRCWGSLFTDFAGFQVVASRSAKGPSSSAPPRVAEDVGQRGGVAVHPDAV